MSFTRGDVRADVQRRLEEFNTTVVTDSDLDQEFLYALLDIEQKIDFRELMDSDTTSLDTVVDQQEYTLPTTNGVIRKMIDLTISNVHYEEVDFLQKDNLQGSQNSVNIGDVAMAGNAYYLYGTTTIGFVPIPSAVADIKFYFYKFHPTVSDDTTALSLPDIVREAIVTRMAASVMKTDETIPNATITNEMNEYERLVGNARQFISNSSRMKIGNFTNY